MSKKKNHRGKTEENHRKKTSNTTVKNRRFIMQFCIRRGGSR